MDQGDWPAEMFLFASQLLSRIRNCLTVHATFLKADFTLRMRLAVLSHCELGVALMGRSPSSLLPRRKEDHVLLWR